MKERTINCIEYVGLCMMLISSIAWHYLNYDIFFVIQILGCIAWLGASIYEAYYFKEERKGIFISIIALVALAIFLILI